MKIVRPAARSSRSSQRATRRRRSARAEAALDVTPRPEIPGRCRDGHGPELQCRRRRKARRASEPRSRVKSAARGATRRARARDADRRDRESRRDAASGRRRLRTLLMLGGIAVVTVGAAVFWLRGGRYVSADDAYVRAAKLMVSTDVSGLVSEIDVHEGEKVAANQVLFKIDPRQFEIALGASQGAARPGRAVDQRDEGGLPAHPERHRRAERAGRSGADQFRSRLLAAQDRFRHAGHLRPDAFHAAGRAKDSAIA